MLKKSVKRICEQTFLFLLKRKRSIKSFFSVIDIALHFVETNCCFFLTNMFLLMLYKSVKTVDIEKYFFSLNAL